MKEKEKDIFDKIMALPGLNIFEGFYQKYKEMLLYLFFGGMTAVISIGSYSYCDVGLGFDPLIANIALQIGDPTPPSAITVYRWHKNYKNARVC